MAAAKLNDEDPNEIHARDLTIYKSDDPRHWTPTYMPDTDGEQVEVFELLGIDKLEVCKKFQFTPGMKYRVEFVLKKNDKEVGFENHPVTFQLAFSNGDTFENRHDLSQSLTNEWTYLPAGAFSRVNDWDMKIRMFEHGSQDKGGIIVNKIVISPENE